MKPSRLVLFDIDGTILTTQRQAWENPFKDAMEQVFAEEDQPRTIDTGQYKPGGKTDTQIIYEILDQNGVPEELVEKFLPKIRTKYLSLLKNVIEGEPDYVQLKPGVKELLADLKPHPEILLGLLTGNFEEGAKRLTGHSFSKKEIVLIGDTPNDIHCGRHLHVRVIAVATGPFTVDQLQAEKPDFVFPDLTDKAKVLDAILGHIAL